MLRILTSAAALSLVAAPAFAHTGIGTAGGFAAGVAHPMLGLDHLLAMVAVGAWGALLGGRAVWLVPAAFVAAMVAGGALAISGVALPMVETAIALSVVVLGALVAVNARLTVGAGMAVVAAFALFHGHAHGSELAQGLSALTYSAGFAAATALLHAAGAAATVAVVRVSSTRAVRWAGIAAAFTGVGLIAGL
ncbi:urease accessory protein UreJ [Thalassobaculum fulvum]|uniref:Urease accessory protein UreJ n=1 Tax=Thalassobaculum fulvum TaxID=1633335 RepID=A0A918XX70_9PROT|nr:HupE/UreJ family protein [Thalassobaculum fulvum]GHD63242.1 urease accessory protein UreJ [Thalassobaculum fulvum]